MGALWDAYYIHGGSGYLTDEPKETMFSGEFGRAELNASNQDRVLVDFDNVRMQQHLHISGRQRKPNLQHHRWPDRLGRGFERAKGAVFRHLSKRGPRLVWLNPFYSACAPSSARPSQFLNSPIDGHGNNEKQTLRRDL